MDSSDEVNDGNKNDGNKKPRASRRRTKYQSFPLPFKRQVIHAYLRFNDGKEKENYSPFMRTDIFQSLCTLHGVTPDRSLVRDWVVAFRKRKNVGKNSYKKSTSSLGHWQQIRDKFAAWVDSGEGIGDDGCITVGVDDILNMCYGWAFDLSLSSFNGTDKFVTSLLEENGFNFKGEPLEDKTAVAVRRNNRRSTNTATINSASLEFEEADENELQNGNNSRSDNASDTEVGSKEDGDTEPDDSGRFDPPDNDDDDGADVMASTDDQPTEPDDSGRFAPPDNDVDDGADVMASNDEENDDEPNTSDQPMASTTGFSKRRSKLAAKPKKTRRYPKRKKFTMRVDDVNIDLDYTISSSAKASYYEEVAKRLYVRCDQKLPC